MRKILVLTVICVSVALFGCGEKSKSISNDAKKTSKKAWKDIKKATNQGVKDIKKAVD
jgi:hypothetical protein